jgi:general secretion pathway protein F
MRFQVKGVRGVSDITVLQIDAASESEARAAVTVQGYEVLSIRSASAFSVPWSREAPFPVTRFTQELIALLGAGLTLVEAIDILQRKETIPTHQAIIQSLLKRLQSGERFSQALGMQAAVFSPLYIATVRASERTGTIRDALSRYLEYQAKIEQVRSKVVSASIYPVLLMLVGGAVCLFLLGYVVPRFSRVYEDLGERLPLLSRLLMEFGQIVDRHSAMVASVMILGFAIALYVASSHRLRMAALQAFWRLPWITEHRRTYELAQFYRTLSMLLRSGLPVIHALDMAKPLLSPDAQQQLDTASQKIAQGQAFPDAMREYGLTTVVAHSMMMVAQRSGNLAEMLDVVAAFHDEELARWVDRFSRLFEPILMTVIGLVIGLIVVFMYMPIFELADAVQ